MNGRTLSASLAGIMFALLMAAPASVPLARDRGVNQPGAAGNRGADPGLNQPGAVGNAGVGAPGAGAAPRAGVGAPGVGVADPGLNQPGVAGNVGGVARRSVRL